LIQRDYSNVSFFDYYYRNNTAARNDNDVKMTDGGRTVYGGGGISPDEKFASEKLSAVETELLIKFAYQGFTQHYFAVHREKLPEGWNVDAKTMDEFHNWLLEHKIEFSEADFTKEYDKIRKRLQHEIYQSAFSVDEAMKFDTRTDPEVEAAVTSLPKAQALLTTARKIAAARMQK
jgi:carboxyl-terminal processing protease